MSKEPQVTQHFISHPGSAVRGECTVPGDKSISHRAIIFGAIAQGVTTIHGFLEGADCLTTMHAFQSMGVDITSSLQSDARCIIIQGVGKYGLKPPPAELDCGNSGTTMRLLAGLLAAQPFASCLIGDSSLQNRPMERISQPLLQMGAQITTTAGHPPLHIHRSPGLHGISYTMPIASAQVKSALLLAGMYAQGEVQLIEEQITRDHTEKMLATFSYPIRKSGNIISIDAANECIATELTVPGDISSAAFFMVAATIVPGSQLMIRNVGINPTRTGVIQILAAMGANIAISNRRLYGAELVADLHIQYAALTGIEIPPNLVSITIDEFPALFIAAACAKGVTILRGAKELRYKESDRIAAMAAGLQQLGIRVQVFEDGISIIGGAFQGGAVDSRHDHRIAMAFAIAGAVAQNPVTVKHCENVKTSFPTFVSTAKMLNLAIEEIQEHGT